MRKVGDAAGHTGAVICGAVSITLSQGMMISDAGPTAVTAQFPNSPQVHSLMYRPGSYQSPWFVPTRGLTWQC